MRFDIEDLDGGERLAALLRAEGEAKAALQGWLLTADAPAGLEESWAQCRSPDTLLEIAGPFLTDDLLIALTLAVLRETALPLNELDPRCGRALDLLEAAASGDLDGAALSEAHELAWSAHRDIHNASSDALGFATNALLNLPLHAGDRDHAVVSLIAAAWSVVKSHMTRASEDVRVQTYTDSCARLSTRVRQTVRCPAYTELLSAHAGD
jgi:hypothetical protein